MRLASSLVGSSSSSSSGSGSSSSSSSSSSSTDDSGGLVPIAFLSLRLHVKYSPIQISNSISVHETGIFIGG